MSVVHGLCRLFNSGDDVDVVAVALRKARATPGVEVALSLFQAAAIRSVHEGRGKVEMASFVLECIRRAVFDPFEGTMTLTFGEVAESHVGMQMIGEKGDRGFSVTDLVEASEFFTQRGFETKLLHLNKFLPKVENVDASEVGALQEAMEDDHRQAYVLVVRDGLKCLTGDSKGHNLLTEMLMFDWDTKMYNGNRKEKQVMDKLARHNLNFSESKQSSDFAVGKGTTIPWREVPLLEELRNTLETAFGDAAQKLKCEGNKYYAKDTGINRHGDTERRKVIGVRLGQPMRLHYTWFYNRRPRGLDMSITLDEGDIYCMSEKAVGTDWKDAPMKQYTLRHAAGADKYTINSDTVKVRNRRPWEGDPETVTIGDLWFRQIKGKHEKVRSDPVMMPN